MKKVLVLDDIHPVFINTLLENNFDCVYRPDITKDEAMKIIGNFEGILVRSKFQITKDVIDAAHKLRFIARSGSGMDDIDVAYAEEKGVSCLRSPEGNCDAVGEHAVAMLLCLMNKVHLANTSVKNGEWNREEHRGAEVSGKTVAIFGYSHMGKAFARKISGFEANVVFYDRYNKSLEDANAKETMLDEIFQTADIVSLHFPWTPENHHFIEEDFLRKFKKPIYLINTARGKVLDTSIISRLIDEKVLIGVGLDVLENEKLSSLTLNEKNIFEALIENKRVLMTPHVAGWTHESYYKLAKVLVDKILALNFP
jgi:D-3-phosphoglycerate dehydrogenase